MYNLLIPIDDFQAVSTLFSDGVKAKVYFRGAPYERDGKTYLKLQQLKLDFSVKDIQMGVNNLHNSNAVLGECFEHISYIGNNLIMDFLLWC